MAKKPARVLSWEHKLALLSVDDPLFKKTRKMLRRARRQWKYSCLRSEAPSAKAQTVSAGVRHADEIWRSYYNGHVESGVALSSPDDPSTSCLTHSEKSAILSTFCRAKYFDASETEDASRARLDRYESLAFNEFCNGHPNSVLHWRHFRLAFSRLKTGRAAGGGSPIVPEILKALDISTIFLLFKAFQARMSDINSEPIESWMKVLICFLGKKFTNSGLFDTRGICLLDVIYKLYVGCIVQVVEGLEPPPICKHIYSIGGCSSVSCAYMVAPLALLAAMCYEWSHVDPIFFFAMDVRFAFDNNSPDLSCKGLSWLGVPPDLIAALLRDERGAWMEATFDGAQTTSGDLYNKCARQGGTDAMLKWNATIRFILAPLFAAWFT